MKVCTFNIRVDNASDGVNVFSGRTPLISEMLSRENLDIIGFQEVRPHMFKWLSDNLDGYTLVGCGRECDRDGEGTPIAFKSDKFYLYSFDTFWLSPTPSIPGSRFLRDQSGCPRVCSVAVLVDKESHELIRIYNTHLDHVGEKARQQGMRVVRKRMEKDNKLYHDTKVILMGDFNAYPDSPFLSEIEELTDVTSHIPVTFHCYGRKEAFGKIDYIYTNMKAENVRILNDKREGVYLSDHYPVVAELQ